MEPTVAVTVPVVWEQVTVMPSQDACACRGGPEINAAVTSTSVTRTAHTRNVKAKGPLASTCLVTTGVSVARALGRTWMECVKVGHDLHGVARA